jgi:hypothetical protein
MKRATGLILGVMIGVAAAAQEPATDKEKTPDYYPLSLGMKWIYAVTNDGQKSKLTSQVARFDTIDGKKLAVVETVIEGTVTGTAHIAATDKGVFCHRMNGIELSPPICILKYPFKKDDTWEVETTVSTEKMTVKGKAVDTEEVTVPAGKYKALKADIDRTIPGMQVSATFWFAPDVGVVKQTMTGAGKETTLVLEKFDTGK